jgi:phage terminase small subunit
MTLSDFTAIERKIKSQKIKDFVYQYVKTGNLNQSILDAGYITPIPSRMGWKLLHNENVKAYIAAIQERVKDENFVSVQMLVEELKAVLTINPFDTLREGTGKDAGKFYTKDLKDLQKVGKYIKKYKIHRKTGEIEVEFYDKMDAIEKLMKHTGGYLEDNKQKKTETAVQIYLPENNRNLTPDVEQNL